MINFTNVNGFWYLLAEIVGCQKKLVLNFVIIHDHYCIVKWKKFCSACSCLTWLNIYCESHCTSLSCHRLACALCWVMPLPVVLYTHSDAQCDKFEIATSRRLTELAMFDVPWWYSESLGSEQSTRVKWRYLNSFITQCVIILGNYMCQNSAWSMQPFCYNTSLW